VTTVALEHDDAGSGAALLLLHGGAGTRDDLAGLRQRLAAGRRIVAPDQRGHGRTPFAEPFTYAAMAEDTAALLDELGAGPADVVGWSDGGIVALHLALARPDLVRRVVVIGTTVDPEPGVTPRQTADATEWLAAATSADLPRDPGFAGADADWRPIADRLLDVWRAPSGVTLADLGRLAAPLLLVAGDRDLFPLEDALAMAREGRAHLAIVPDADHHVPRTEPALVAALVERFLAAA
jgi:pimeloyl-ACP methyl ester carboxylesterase